MSFKARNSFYLRISANCILPVYLYLDDKHLEWMSEKTLQHVLEDLRPKILPKLQAENEGQTGSSASSMKKGSVETHRGDDYHFCYFVRKTQPHSIVMKTRSFATAPRETTIHMPPPPVPKPSSRKKRKVQEPVEVVLSEEDDDDDDVEMVGSDDADYVPGTSTAGKKRRRIQTVHFDLVEEEEEEKPKPVLNLKYRGFSIYGQCLCIVVEPWPPMKAPSRAPSIFRSTPAPAARQSSIAPPEFVSVVEARTRAQTPLFLPDVDDERESTPFTSSRASVPPGLLQFDEDDDDDGGIMQFSQVLNTTGDNRAGAIDEDEDMEGAVLFGDADEYKEL